jgi:thiosulfate reductase cytochrome b subunit
VLGRTFVTTGVLGYTDDGLGGRAPRAFPAWLTLPGPQDLADGRLWHFFFGWMLVLAVAIYLVSAARRGTLRALVVRRSDLPGILPMVAYYVRLRRKPPAYVTYNPLQKLAYTTVIFVLFPVVVLTGFALSPGIDSALPWLTAIFGGRQFARLWHFVAMALLVGFTAGHLVMVATTGVWNNMRSMITGWYAEHPVRAK